ncbi:Solute carrier family 22 member 1 [Eumeta japonica]|uniref:Solute carrier family 22 member 1 n=1 Tax=Eumeta variegata TaxID=151549 RepID=A0A4C1ZRY2_EUMVA|nr:Solute carrier family 22 member 1 [Eumeta japonica]
MFQPCDLAEDRLLHCAHLASVNNIVSHYLTLSFDSASDLYYKVGFDDGLMNLACNPWKVVMVGVMHNLGMLVSMVIVGWLTDRYGRKPFLIICSAGSCIGIVKSFLNSYYWFIAIEFLESSIGAGLYTVGSVIGNKYTNFIISALMSFPGEMMSYFFMSYYGRKYPLMIGFVVCGALCIGLAFVPDSLPWLQIALFTLGKLLVAMCFTGVCTYTLEMFPTSTRGTVIGICSLFSRIGSLLSPLTPLLRIRSGEQIRGSAVGCMLHVNACCRQASGKGDTFEIKIRIYQGATLSSLLFKIVMDHLKKHCQKSLPWNILYANDAVMISENIEDLQLDFNSWINVLETNGLKISRKKTEHMSCTFYGVASPNDREISIGSRTSTGWIKWRHLTDVMCDRIMSLKIKEQMYKTDIRPAIPHGSKFWVTKKYHLNKLLTAEMRSNAGQRETLTVVRSRSKTPRRPYDKARPKSINIEMLSWKATRHLADDDRQRSSSARISFG